MSINNIVTIQRKPFLIFRCLLKRQFHESQKIDVFFRWSHKNTSYKPLIINIIRFADSLNSYIIFATILAPQMYAKVNLDTIISQVTKAQLRRNPTDTIKLVKTEKNIQITSL